MLIERNGFDKDRATSVTKLRAACLDCADCTGPCHMLIQLSALPDILLAIGEARA